MYNSYKFALPALILIIFLWFFPRKKPLALYHKIHWEALWVYTAGFVGPWLTLCDTSPVSIAVNLHMSSIASGFFCKPLVYWIFFPLISVITFYLFTLATGADVDTLLPLVSYPFAVSMIFGTIAVLVRIVMEYYYHKLLDTELVMLKMQAEKKLSDLKLSSLRAKCDPHFLFNTLNSICHLARTNSSMTETAILSLSNLFRYILETGDQNIIELERELSIVHNYLELEKIRYNDRLSFEINPNNSKKLVFVPPLSIQPLVENSVKHGFSPYHERLVITIDINVTTTAAIISVKDNGVGFGDNQPVFGHGLTMLEDRLMHIWGKKASLRINSVAHSGTTVELHIPLQEKTDALSCNLN
jgi:sensor histidine kinase YesM